MQAAELLRTLIGPATGLELPVDAQGGEIELSVAPERAVLGSEGYHLHIDDVGVTIVAAGGSGLRWAVQTLASSGRSVFDGADQRRGLGDPGRRHP